MTQMRRKHTTRIPGPLVHIPDNAQALLLTEQALHMQFEDEKIEFDRRCFSLQRNSESR
jgi:hypothetical protein